MATASYTHMRPLTHPKRVKLVSTCDNCKDRKVKCDKERPECGACKRTGRSCSYTYSALSVAIRESGGRRPQDWVDMSNRLNNLQATQERRIDQTQNFISMVLRGQGGVMNATGENRNEEFAGIVGQQVQGEVLVPSLPTMYNPGMGPPPPSINQELAHSVLQHSTEIASKIDRPVEQCQYDPKYFLNSADFAMLVQQQVPLSQPTAASSNQPSQSIDSSSSLEHQKRQQIPMDQLISAFEELNMYQSTRYIGEGSLLLLGDGDDNNEKFVPDQKGQDLSSVYNLYKYLPDAATVQQLIFLYYKHLHRYAPFLRRQVVDNALKDLSKPQNLLLLNCVFFAASPFHEDLEKRDGRIYFERAEALLYKYCRTQPHVLTVIATVLLGHHNKQLGSRWMYSGIATKMLFELGLHRKMNVKIHFQKEVTRLRNEAFWMTFISENFISATYGRPNMIDESDCDVDIPELPSDLSPPDEESRLDIVFNYWMRLSRICVRVREYLHKASRRKFVVQDSENRFKILDVQLHNWFQSLPQWLRFDEMASDMEGSFLNGIGGDLHIFFYTVLILLYSRYLRPPGEYENYPIDSLSTCTNAAKIIVQWLDILLDYKPDFFAHSVCGPLAINPAMRVFAWNATYMKDTKAEQILEHLKQVKLRIDDISQKYDRGREYSDETSQGHQRLMNELLGTIKPEEQLNMQARGWEVFIADDDFATRNQFRQLAWKQQGMFGRRRSSRGMSGSSAGGPSRQMSWTSTSGNGGSANRQMSWTSTSVPGPSRRMSSFSSKNYKWYSQQPDQPLSEEPQDMGESPIQETDLNFVFVADKKYTFSYHSSPDQKEIEQRQQDDLNLFSTDDSDPYPSSSQLNLYTNTTGAPALSSTPDHQQQRQISTVQLVQPPQAARPQEIESSSNDQQRGVDRIGDNLHYDNATPYSQHHQHHQLPITPPHNSPNQQNYSENNQLDNNLLLSNTINDTNNDNVLWSPQLHNNNQHPSRTDSNSSTILTPPMNPDDELHYTPQPPTSSIDELTDDNEFWNLIKNDNILIGAGGDGDPLSGEGN